MSHVGARGHHERQNCIDFGADAQRLGQDPCTVSAAAAKTLWTSQKLSSSNFGANTCCEKVSNEGTDIHGNEHSLLDLWSSKSSCHDDDYFEQQTTPWLTTEEITTKIRAGPSSLLSVL